MIAILKILSTGELLVAYCRDANSKLRVWERPSGSYLLGSWLEVVEILDMPMEEVKLVYPEYFV